MKNIFGGALRFATATLLTAFAVLGGVYGEFSTWLLSHFLESSFPLLAIIGLPFAFLGWRTLFVTFGITIALMLAAPLDFLPVWFSLGLCLSVAAVVQLAWQQVQSRAPAVRVRDEKGRYVELSVLRREDSHLLQLVSAESRAALASAAPSVLPVGALKLTETPVMDDRLVVYPGYINVNTGYFSQGGAFTQKVDTGRRFIRIANEGGVVMPPSNLLDPDARRAPAEAGAGGQPTSIGFVVKKSESARLHRWWKGHRRELALGGKEAAQKALQARMAAEVAAAKKAARLNGVAEYRVDRQGRVTHYLEINRAGDAYVRIKGEETRVAGPAGADLVLALRDPRNAPAGTPAWDGGAALPAGTEAEKMARFVKQTR